MTAHAIAPVIRSKYPWVNNDPANVNSGYDFDGSHTVSEYACRNCHDPHTIQGAKRLHREGVNAQGTDGIESTCYLCHAPNSGSTAPGTLVAGEPTSSANPRFVPATGRPAPALHGRGEAQARISRSQGSLRLMTRWSPALSKAAWRDRAS